MFSVGGFVCIASCSSKDKRRRKYCCAWNLGIGYSQNLACLCNGWFNDSRIAYDRHGQPNHCRKQQDGITLAYFSHNAWGWVQLKANEPLSFIQYTDEALQKMIADVSSHARVGDTAYSA
jgi:hypothetical protein